MGVGGVDGIPPAVGESVTMGPLLWEGPLWTKSHSVVVGPLQRGGVSDVAQCVAQL